MADEVGPDDPIGTVRAGDGNLAVRAYRTHPDADNHDLAWFIINIGARIDSWDDGIENLIAAWPIVYQPVSDAVVDTDGHIGGLSPRLMSERTQEWRSAYRKLDEAVNELHRLIERDNAEPGDVPSVPTDYVLLVGWMFYDEDNDRVGGVNLFPKQGSQPAYITTGLMASGLDSISR